MSDARPEGLVNVQPKAVAVYTAMRWIGDENDPALLWLVHNHNWKIAGMRDSPRKGRCLMLIGKNNKRYLVANGDYIVALGANGSLRVCTRSEYDREYKEVEA